MHEIIAVELSKTNRHGPDKRECEGEVQFNGIGTDLVRYSLRCRRFFLPWLTITCAVAVRLDVLIRRFRHHNEVHLEMIAEEVCLDMLNKRSDSFDVRDVDVEGRGDFVGGTGILHDKKLKSTEGARGDTVGLLN